VSFKPLVLSVSLSLAAVLFPVWSASQAGNVRSPFPPLQQPSQNDEEERARAKELAKKANQERQAQLKRDAGDLLKLAAELKQDVDKSSADILSVDVIKKADEIEKLAHSVKEKMKAN
jgi:hypothetical protein